MPRREKYVPKHRREPADSTLQRTLRRSAAYSGVAVAATGIAVSGGVVLEDEAPADPATSALAAVQAEYRTAPADGVTNEERTLPRSRSGSRPRVDPATKEAPAEKSGRRATRSQDLASRDPREIARRLMPKYGFAASEFGCLDALWVSESDWRVDADNPTSSAYGIPQALTGGTHDNLPADYMTNPVSQIEWGLWYIRETYGSPCAAWAFKQGNNWY